MISSAYLVLLTTLFLTASARNITPLHPPSPKVLSLDLERRLPSDVLAYESKRLRKRQNVVEVTLDNQKTLYFANVTLGTPPQQLQLHIDTGSSDLWVNVANSTLCRRFERCEGGTFDPSASSSINVVNNKFNISYMDGTGAVGNYVSDTMGFGSLTLEKFQFGLGDRSTSSEGVLGIGYVDNEMQVLRGGMQAYPNLPLALFQGGHISRNAYSLWLNDLDASTGTILFGGVNRAKYQGELATLPILNARKGFVELSVALTGVAMSGQAITAGTLPLPALLDTGSTLCYLPTPIARSIYSQLNNSVEVTQGTPYAPCDLQSRAGTIDFSFSGKVISVAFDELLVDLGVDENGRPYLLDDGRRACLFGIAPGDDDMIVLGDTFLRSAYVVYDLGNNEISLAQTIFNTTENNVQEIAAGSGPLPGAYRAKDADANASQAEQATNRSSGPTSKGTRLAISEQNIVSSIVFFFSTIILLNSL